MTLLTGGTTASTSLSAHQVSRSGSAINIANTALFSVAVLDDQNVAHPVWPGAFTKSCQLFVPNRGFLNCLPGDYVMVDSTGWPILLSARAIAAGPWAHS